MPKTPPKAPPNGSRNEKHRSSALRWLARLLVLLGLLLLIQWWLRREEPPEPQSPEPEPSETSEVIPAPPPRVPKPRDTALDLEVAPVAEPRRAFDLGCRSSAAAVPDYDPLVGEDRPFAAGEIVRFEDLNLLKPYLPAPVWEQRRFFFYEGMKLELARGYQDYSPAQPYCEATQRFAGEAGIDRDGELENYTAGQPFPTDDIDFTIDPNAAVKIAWNFWHQWSGAGSDARFRITSLGRGEEQRIFYEGRFRAAQLAHRVEPQYLERQHGDRFRSERRFWVARAKAREGGTSGRDVEFLDFRYKSSRNPGWIEREPHLFVYLQALDRVRRVADAGRYETLLGMRFSLFDVNGFAGRIPDFEWIFVAETNLIAPANSRANAFPYSRDHDFGPLGLSLANDRWEMREALQIRLVPKERTPPFAYRDLYLDRETLMALYTATYDNDGNLWKLQAFAGRWSEGDTIFYPAWEGVPVPRDLKQVGAVLVDVQTGSGVRLEYWNNQGAPIGTTGALRQLADPGSLGRRSELW